MGNTQGFYTHTAHTNANQSDSIKQVNQSAIKRMHNQQLQLFTLSKGPVMSINTPGKNENQIGQQRSLGTNRLAIKDPSFKKMYTNGTRLHQTSIISKFNQPNRIKSMQIQSIHSKTTQNVKIEEHPNDQSYQQLRPSIIKSRNPDMHNQGLVIQEMIDTKSFPLKVNIKDIQRNYTEQIPDRKLSQVESKSIKNSDEFIGPTRSTPLWWEPTNATYLQTKPKLSKRYEFGFFEGQQYQWQPEDKSKLDKGLIEKTFMTKEEKIEKKKEKKEKKKEYKETEMGIKSDKKERARIMSTPLWTEKEKRVKKKEKLKTSLNVLTKIEAEKKAEKKAEIEELKAKSKHEFDQDIGEIGEQSVDDDEFELFKVEHYELKMPSQFIQPQSQHDFFDQTLEVVATKEPSTMHKDFDNSKSQKNQDKPSKPTENSSTFQEEQVLEVKNDASQKFQIDYVDDLYDDEEDCDGEECFVFDEDVKPDMSSYSKRFKHYVDLTDPKHFLESDEKILKCSKILERIEKLEESKTDQNQQMNVKKSFKKYVKKLKVISESSMSGKGEDLHIVEKQFRLNSVIPINMGLICGMLLSPPTIAYTIFWQVMSNIQCARVNYEFKKEDYKGIDQEEKAQRQKGLLVNYCIASFTAVTSSVFIRLLTKSMAISAEGSSILILNTFVAQLSSLIGHSISSLQMHTTALTKGLPVYQKEDYNAEYDKEVGFSTVAGKKSFIQTVVSRFIMSFTCVTMPTLVVLGLQHIGLRPSAQIAKLAIEIMSIGACLSIAYPLSAAIFSPQQKIDAKKSEAELKQNDDLYLQDDLYFEKKAIVPNLY